MIAQSLAARHPERVLSLVSIMSTTGNRFKGQPAFRVYPTFLARPPRTKEDSVERIARLFKMIGSLAFDHDDSELARDGRAGRDRGYCPPAPEPPLAAIIAPATARLDVRAHHRADVIHGAKDLLVRPSGDGRRRGPSWARAC